LDAINASADELNNNILIVDDDQDTGWLLESPLRMKGYCTEVVYNDQEELDEAICNMFVQCVSTTKVGDMVEALTGAPPNPSMVSRVFHTLEEEFESWNSRPLQFH
jgi:hypothetical protein